MGLIPEKAARLAAAFAVVAGIAAYHFGTAPIEYIALTLAGTAMGGAALVLLGMAVGWICLGSIRLSQIMEKHDSGTKLGVVFIAAWLLSGAIAWWMLK